jgi:hypothetical protein
MLKYDAKVKIQYQKVKKSVLLVKNRTVNLEDTTYAY